LPKKKKDEAQVTSTTLDAKELALEFRVSEAVMTAFIDRFAPSKVPIGQFASASEVMLFIHIPKTAGISVGESLRDAFDCFHGVEWTNIPQSFRAAVRHALYQNTVQDERHVIMGHFGWPEMQVFRNHDIPLKCGTFLRNPVDRTISNYNYNCSEAHPANQDFRARFPTLDAYVAELPIDVQVTQCLGMISSLENALEKLIGYYSFLGLTERLIDSLDHLGQSHGFSNLREHRKNVGKKSNRSEVAPNLIRSIEQRSHNDKRLHDLMMRLYQA
jgi:hypothetical protein